MEMWEGLEYDAILAMPSTRRQRLIHKKVELEKKRNSNAK